MNSLQNISVVATNLIPALVFMGMSDMLRLILASEVEERLGRKLTNEEWHYYLQENHRKREAEHRQQIVGQRYQQLIDRQIIHDYVWGKKSTKTSFDWGAVSSVSL